MRGKSVLRWSIGFIRSHFKTSLSGFIGFILFQFQHLLILRTSLLQWISRWCSLLLLAGGWLKLGAPHLVLDNAVVQQNSSQNTNQETTYEHYYCSSWDCNPHIGISRRCFYSTWIWEKYTFNYQIKCLQCKKAGLEEQISYRIQKQSLS